MASRNSSHHWSFRVVRTLLSVVDPVTVITNAIRHTKRILAERAERRHLAEQHAIAERSRFCKPAVAVCVTEVEVDGETRNIWCEPLKFVKKGTKHVESAMGTLVAVARGKQFRYVPLAA